MCMCACMCVCVYAYLSLLYSKCMYTERCTYEHIRCAPDGLHTYVVCINVLSFCTMDGKETMLTSSHLARLQLPMT